MKTKNQNAGFIHMIILFIIFCVIIWYFNINVSGYINSHKELRDSLLGMINYLKGIWQTYLAGAWTFIWNNIITDIIWKNLAPLIHKV